MAIPNNDTVNAIDDRLVEISIEVNGKMKSYTDLQIRASGTKYANPIENQCDIQIFNLDKATRDYLLTATSPFNRNRRLKRFIVKAGRKSYGLSKIYEGDIVEAYPSQPPDISINLKSMTKSFLSGSVISTNQAGSASLNDIARIASDYMGTVLDFQATDRTISNYSYSGAATKQVGAINDLGGLNVYVDDNTFVVKDANSPLRGKIKVLDAQSGMIGIPEMNEQGLKVTYLLDNVSRLGGLLRVKSEIYPIVSGDYVIYKLSFDISTRDTPFYYIAECKRIR